MNMRGNVTVKYILLLHIFLYVALAGCTPRITNYRPQSYSDHKRILGILKHNGLSDSFVTSEFVEEYHANNISWATSYPQYNIPIYIDWNKTISDIDTELQKNHFQSVIEQIQQAPPLNTATITVLKRNLPVMKISLSQKIRGFMAIVIDDLGHNTKALDQALLIDRPITYAVLPQLAKSTYLAERVHQHGDIVILHQPMASKKKLDPGPGAIMPGMSETQVRAILEDNIRSVPYVQGLNNHMGSAITTDKRLMRFIMSYLKEKNIFFLDSLTEKNICPEISSELGFPIYRRDVFLDNKRDRDYIFAQIDHLAKITLKRGWAIGIGHFYPITLECIRRKIPQLEKSGIKLVYINELNKR